MVLDLNIQITIICSTKPFKTFRMFGLGHTLNFIADGILSYANVGNISHHDWHGCT
jgi:hypothetical protein